MILILILLVLAFVYVGWPALLGVVLFLGLKRLGCRRRAKIITVGCLLVTVIVQYLYERVEHSREMDRLVLLADREAPLGWIYLRIFKDSTFELENRGLERKGEIFAGKARITADSIFFHYHDAIPWTGTKAVYSKDYVVYTDSAIHESVHITLNRLMNK